VQKRGFKQMRNGIILFDAVNAMLGFAGIASRIKGMSLQPEKTAPVSTPEAMPSRNDGFRAGKDGRKVSAAGDSGSQRAGRKVI